MHASHLELSKVVGKKEERRCEREKWGKKKLYIYVYIYIYIFFCLLIKLAKWLIGNPSIVIGVSGICPLDRSSRIKI